MKKHWKFLFHIKIADDLRVRHNFEPKSFLQLQGHFRKKMHNTCLDLSCIMKNDKKARLDTKIACDLKICPDLEIWSFLQVQGHYKKKMVIHYFPILLYFHSRRICLLTVYLKNTCNQDCKQFYLFFMFSRMSLLSFSMIPILQKKGKRGREKIRENKKSTVCILPQCK